MATVLRFARFGAKKNPFYHLVATSSRSPRDSHYIEKLGTFNPLLGKENPSRVKFNEERVKHWLSVGAKPSEKVEKLLSQLGWVKLSVDYTQKPKKSVKKPEKYGTSATATPAGETASAAGEETAAPVETPTANGEAAA